MDQELAPSIVPAPNNWTVEIFNKHIYNEQRKRRLEMIISQELYDYNTFITTYTVFIRSKAALE